MLLKFVIVFCLFFDASIIIISALMLGIWIAFCFNKTRFTWHGLQSLQETVVVMLKCPLYLCTNVQMLKCELISCCTTAQIWTSPCSKFIPPRLNLHLTWHLTWQHPVQDTLSAVCIGEKVFCPLIDGQTGVLNENKSIIPLYDCYKKNPQNTGLS